MFKRLHYRLYKKLSEVLGNAEPECTAGSEVSVKLGGVNTAVLGSAAADANLDPGVQEQVLPPIMMISEYQIGTGIIGID